MKKEFFCIVDVETTNQDKVFDFAAIVADRKGNIHKKCAVIVSEFSTQDLFFIPNNGKWSKEIATRKKGEYINMVEDGRRMVASVPKINAWINKVIGEYNPTLTAYNLGFDSNRCEASGIMLNDFKNSFCLWHTAVNIFAYSKNFRAFALENHYFNNRTKNANMVMQTNAEIMAHYLTGKFQEEPHTALEDAQFFELPILKAIVNRKGWKEKTTEPYNWQNHVVRDLFKPA